jgi:hypothetical protein
MLWLSLERRSVITNLVRAQSEIVVQRRRYIARLN